ncbi:hypothetical protein BDR04DRAFT_1090543 [Suillus decipiens]|nr:hypothetical protein BDR04DRAFT_1090543 [Suillus decipiens]
MRFSILAAVVALTASMYVSAQCVPSKAPCSSTESSGCCSGLCATYDDINWFCV